MHPLLNIISETTDEKVRNELYFQMTEDIVEALQIAVPHKNYFTLFPNGKKVAVYKILYQYTDKSNINDPITEIIFRRYFKQDSMKMEIFMNKERYVSFLDDEFKFKIYKYKTQNIDFIYFIYEAKNHKCSNDCDCEYRCPNRLVILME